MDKKKKKKEQFDLDQKLIEAAERLDVKEVLELVKKGGNANRDIDEKTPIK